MKAAGWEIASHGLKWVEHKDMPEAEERAAIREAIRLHAEVTGAPRAAGTPGAARSTPCGSRPRRAASTTSRTPMTTTCRTGWTSVGARDRLIIPYTLDANDMRFATPQGFNTGDHFEAYLKDSFDCALCRGGGQGRMMMASGCTAG
jgi:peptidoglycan/xylan/chitin deacetylase (PgdA/CDA1 family)